MATRTARVSTVDMGPIDIDGANITEWFDVQRVHDESGKIQFVLTDEGDITAGLAAVLGRVAPDALSITLHVVDLTVITSGHFVDNIPLFPQMALATDSTSASTASPKSTVRMFLQE